VAHDRSGVYFVERAAPLPQLLCATPSVRSESDRLGGWLDVVLDRASERLAPARWLCGLALCG
jgi:hypothetical protein